MTTRDLTVGKKYCDYVNHQVKEAYQKNDSARIQYYSERKRWKNQIRKQLDWLKNVLGGF